MAAARPLNHKGRRGHDGKRGLWSLTQGVHAIARRFPDNSLLIPWWVRSQSVNMRVSGQSDVIREKTP
jgi:hypothetical protein